MTTHKEALKLALEALENLPALNWIPEKDMQVQEAIIAIKEALAQPEQEPVAIYQYQMGNGSWIDQDQGSYRYNKQHGHTVRIVYTTPPQRKPLTDDEAFKLIEQDYQMEEYAQAALQLIRRTEAAHGIKE